MRRGHRRIGQAAAEPLGVATVPGSLVVLTTYKMSTPSSQYDLHVFDGFRPRSVQSDLFDEYATKLSQDHGMDTATARLQARTFVSDPDTVYPHGTGGTVDLTLSINGHIAWLGTHFDDFTPQSHRHWFDNHPPETPDEITAHHNRQILYESMGQAGFVGLAEEWWHYEWGTHRWAEEKHCQPVLTHLAEFP